MDFHSSILARITVVGLERTNRYLWLLLANPGRNYLSTHLFLLGTIEFANYGYLQTFVVEYIIIRHLHGSKIWQK